MDKLRCECVYLKIIFYNFSLDDIVHLFILMIYLTDITDIFSQISDSNGLLLMWRFNEYLQEVLALPAAVYESPSFSYVDTLASSIFIQVRHKI